MRNNLIKVKGEGEGERQGRDNKGRSRRGGGEEESRTRWYDPAAAVEVETGLLGGAGRHRIQIRGFFSEKKGLIEG